MKSSLLKPLIVTCLTILGTHTYALAGDGVPITKPNLKLATAPAVNYAIALTDNLLKDYTFAVEGPSQTTPITSSNVIIPVSGPTGASQSSYYIDIIRKKDNKKFLFWLQYTDRDCSIDANADSNPKSYSGKEFSYSAQTKLSTGAYQQVLDEEGVICLNQGNDTQYEIGIRMLDIAFNTLPILIANNVPADQGPQLRIINVITTNLSLGS